MASTPSQEDEEHRTYEPSKGQISSLGRLRIASEDWSSSTSLKPLPYKFAERSLGSNITNALQDHSYFSLPSQNPLTSVVDFIELLRGCGLAGPFTVEGPRTFLGGGAQFAVYAQHCLAGNLSKVWIAAIKRPLFLLDAHQQLSLADGRVKQQIHDMYLEILALSHPALYKHKNIADPFGWGIDDETSWHRAPFLIQERAETNLDALLATDKLEEKWDLKVRICSDIGAALDVIHENTIVHGDLKPANVLMFWEDDYTAKLADFGLSTRDPDAGSGPQIRGTPGWQAPEVKAEQIIAPDELCKTDNYSYGLLIWSVFLLKGKPPLITCPEDAVAIFANALAGIKSKIPQSIYMAVKDAVSSLLQVDPKTRPRSVHDLFKDVLLENDQWQVQA